MKLSFFIILLFIYISNVPDELVDVVHGVVRVIAVWWRRYGFIVQPDDCPCVSQFAAVPRFLFVEHAKIGITENRDVKVGAFGPDGDTFRCGTDARNKTFQFAQCLLDGDGRVRTKTYLLYLFILLLPPL